MADQIIPLERVVEVLGSQSEVARVVGVTPQAVSDAVRKGRETPPKWCIPIERATKGQITRHQLRPDLYPTDDKASAA